MMLDLIFIALMQAALGDPAPATDPAAQPSPAATQQPADQAGAQTSEQTPAADAVRCRRERLSGSRLTERVCTTAAQDEELRDNARNMINRAQSQITTRD